MLPKIAQMSMILELVIEICLLSPSFIFPYFSTAKFVDDNRAVLIQDVSEVMAIAEELGAMVHRETYSVIEAKETSQDKMRVLYQRTLRSGGVVVKAAFFDILKTHQPQIMERLGSFSSC